jgi:purine-binding chemotaxis protein CheW
MIAAEAQANQLCTFFVHGIHFGIDVREVQEVLRQQATTTVPLARPSVAGLINLRGEIVTALDLRRLLGLPPRQTTKRLMNVVLKTEEGLVALLVDEIGDVMDVDSTEFEMPPSTVPAASRRLLVGVHKLEERLLMVIDTKRLMEPEA